ILILDEATSALDSRTEEAIQSTLNDVARNRTTIVIAHRLSTVVGADQIVVLDAGQVAERGTHAELLAKGGLYAELWTRQAAERELEEAVEWSWPCARFNWLPILLILRRTISASPLNRMFQLMCGFSLSIFRPVTTLQASRQEASQNETASWLSKFRSIARI